MRAWDLWDAPLGRSTDDACQQLHLPVRTGAQRWRGAMTFPGAGSTTGLSLTVTLRRHWTLCDANRSTFLSFENPTPAERLSASYHNVGGCGSAIVGGGAGAGSRSDCGEGAGVPIVRSCGCVKPWCGECPSPVLSQHQPQQHQPQQQQQQPQQQHSGHTEESSSRIQSCRQQAGTWGAALIVHDDHSMLQCCDRLRGPLWLDDVAVNARLPVYHPPLIAACTHPCTPASPSPILSRNSPSTGRPPSSATLAQRRCHRPADPAGV